MSTMSVISCCTPPPPVHHLTPVPHLCLSSAATSNSEATRAQGESMLEDPENTEHDISVTEATSETHPADGADGDDQDQDEVLEEIMDQLLERWVNSCLVEGRGLGWKAGVEKGVDDGLSSG